VRAAGGWLFDTAMTGWDVQVLAGDPRDGRALRILGARAADLEAALTSPVYGPRPHALAVDAELYDSDRRVRWLVRNSLDDGLTEVRLWGLRWQADSDDEIGSMRHRLSAAARAFKARALEAADAPADPVGGTEVFHSGEMLAYPPEQPDLVPA